MSVLRIDGKIVATGYFVDTHITRGYVLPEQQKKGYRPFETMTFDKHIEI